MAKSQFEIRKAEASDFQEIKRLYQLVAKTSGGIARTEDEITDEYIEKSISNSLATGVLIIAKEIVSEKIIGELHCYKLSPKVFNHVLSELTVVVHPNYKKNGVAKSFFMFLLNEVKLNRPDIRRIELIAKESNKAAIQFYEKIGFKKEGILERRIANSDGSFEADIIMAWLK
jgi:RimJ/RimL family protein N-acetyltransferase